MISTRWLAKRKPHWQRLEQLVGQPIIDEHGNRRARRYQCGHLRLHFLPLLFLALNVDSPAQQLGRQAHVLPLLANG